jgi:Cd2+/Zn2+-exporting ATPase/copper chaperone
MLNIFKNKAKNEKASFTIEGMHCTSCAMVIDGALEDTDGVLNATTSYAKSVVSVEFDKNKVDENKLKKVIIANGYSVKE